MANMIRNSKYLVLTYKSLIILRVRIIKLTMLNVALSVIRQKQIKTKALI